MIETIKQRTIKFFQEDNGLRWLILVAMFIASFGIRSYNAITEPYHEFHVRQYHSLIIARGYYYEAADFPEEETNIAVLNRDRMSFVEPRVTEFFVAQLYRLIGREIAWLPNIVVSVFWLIGGIAVYLLARELGSEDAAIFATAFYLFLPHGVLEGNNFQPDPLMMMFLLWSVYALLRYTETPTTKTLLIASALSGIAIFVKLQSGFFIMMAFLALSIYRMGLRKTLLNRDSYIFGVIAVTPVILYLIYGFQHGFFENETTGRFLPQLWLEPSYWRGWLRLLHDSVSFAGLIFGLLGLLAVQNKRFRYLLVGLWVGYVVYGLIFSFNISTHAYYQLPLIPIVGLSLGSLVPVIIDHLKQVNSNRLSHLMVYGILLSGVAFSVLLVLRGSNIETDFESEVQTAIEIGEEIDHNPNTLYLADAYGLPLIYHGELSGEFWPSVSDVEFTAYSGGLVQSVEERFTNNPIVDNPEYFVVTNFEEFARQPELEAYLNDNFPIIAETDDYIIYDLHTTNAITQNTGG